MILIFYSTMKKSGTENLEQQQEKSGLLKELKTYFTPFNVVIISLIVIGSMALISGWICNVERYNSLGKRLQLNIFWLPNRRKYQFGNRFTTYSLLSNRNPTSFLSDSIVVSKKME